MGYFFALRLDLSPEPGVSCEGTFRNLRGRNGNEDQIPRYRLRLGQSPTLFATDRGTLVVRGYAITDPEALTALGEVPEGELDIEIPAELLRFFDSPMKHHPRWAPEGNSEDGDSVEEDSEEER
jgi:hypothetical protein